MIGRGRLRAPVRRRGAAVFAPRRRRPGLVWGLAFAGLVGGYGALAPVVDDLRSRLRPMAAACAVAGVIDGDTVDLRCTDGRGGRARIVGYDAPELVSPRCAAEAEAADLARAALQALVGRARRTETAFLGRDRYDRALVDLRLDGVRVATAMVDAGHGRRYFGAARGGWCRR